MIAHDPLLKIRFDGDAVGPGTIPVAHLRRFLDGMTKALQRTGRVLLGEAESMRRGPHPRSVKDEVALDLVMLTQGSPAAVLGFERRQTETSLPGIDLGMEILEKSITGLEVVQKADAPLPPGYNAGVLMAWRDAGLLFSSNIARIEFRLRERDKSVVTTFTPEGFARIQKRIKGPQTNMRTIEGRLLMVDFKEHGTRCRVHPPVGDPVICLFDDEQKDEVLEDILRYVRIVGEAREDPLTGKISSIKIHDIEQLEEKEDQAMELLPQGTPVSRDFWYSPTLDELAQAQNAGSVTNVEALFGGWPGDPDDGFEKEILKIRRVGVIGN